MTFSEDELQALRGTIVLVSGSMHFPILSKTSAMSTAVIKGRLKDWDLDKGTFTLVGDAEVADPSRQPDKDPSDTGWEVIERLGLNEIRQFEFLKINLQHK
jgi:hypothetical protein